MTTQSLFGTLTTRFSTQPGDYTETGYIDLLYKSTEGWQVVDFKTDVIRDEQGLQETR